MKKLIALVLAALVLTACAAVAGKGWKWRGSAEPVAGWTWEGGGAPAIEAARSQG
jgi:hypothetical protein